MLHSVTTPLFCFIFWFIFPNTKSNGVYRYVKRNTLTYFCNYTSHFTGSAVIRYLFVFFTFSLSVRISLVQNTNKVFSAVNFKNLCVFVLWRKTSVFETAIIELVFYFHGFILEFYKCRQILVILNIITTLNGCNQFVIVIVRCGLVGLSRLLSHAGPSLSIIKAECTRFKYFT